MQRKVRGRVQEKSPETVIENEVRIGIDPDCDKNGVCVYDTKTKEVSVYAMAFPNLIDYLCLLSNEHDKERYTVIVECGGQVSHNWHLSNESSAFLSAQMGSRVGRNFETGNKIAEMSEYRGLRTRKIQPLKSRIWGGTDKKIKHDEFVEVIERFGIKYPSKRENQDVRDSVMIALFG